VAALAEQTGGKYIELDRIERLRDTFVQIVNEFRSRYVLTYQPSGVSDSGWHPITVKVKRRGDVIARRGYMR
jgi:hypothetical protein